MKINRLRLRGWIGVRRGLGLDEIDLDLSGLSGLIALSGKNGAGKSSLLDNLHPFRCLASRNRSLQHHVFLRDSFRELEFEFNGDQYRTLIKIDADSERSEAFLWRNGQSLVDGKVTNYDRTISELFGSQTLFFNSVFCAQNAKKLNEMTTGDLKKLFSEFLRLDRLIEFENTSKQCAVILSGRCEKLNQEIDVLKASIEGKEEATVKLTRAEEEKRDAEQTLSKLSEDLKQAETELTDIQAVISKNELARVRIKDMEESRTRIGKEIEADQRQSEAELSDLRSKVRDIGLEIVGGESLLANENEIRQAAERFESLTARIEETKKSLETAQDDYFITTQKLEKKDKERLKAQAILETIEHDYEVQALEHRIEQCKEKMADLDKKDPDCKSTTCSFIVGALEAQKQLPELERKLADRRSKAVKKKSEYENTIKAINAEMDTLSKQCAEKKKTYDDLKAAISKSASELENVKKLAADLPRIEVAASKKADLEKRKAELTQEGLNIKESWEKRIQGKQDQQEQIDGKIREIRKNIDNSADEKYRSWQNEINRIRTDINNINNNILPGLEATIKILENEIAQKTQAEKDLEARLAERTRIVNESSEWTYLKNACSKDGLRALEIDSVAPVITGYANDLLLKTFGPTFSVRFKTQDEETGREILDILVIRDDGSEILLDNLSGGQQLWILQALRLAMTLISKEKSGKTFKSIFCDEFDGPIDIDNAQNFIGLYRSMMDAGGFDSCYFVSHKPSCINMARHVINFNGKGIEIE